MRTIKKGIFYLLLTTLTLGGASCNKLLDVTPKGIISSDTFWKNEGQAVAAVAGMYANLSVSNPNFVVGQTNFNNLSAIYLTPQEAYIYWGEMRGEILANNPTKMPAAQLSKENVDAYLVAPGDPTTRYAAFYKIINQANLAIAKIPDVTKLDPNFTPLEAQQLVGEAYFIRAFCYFLLARTFKEVPLILDAYTRDDQTFNIPKSTSGQIFSQIISDLNLAQKQLPEWYTSSLYPRIRATKYTAQTVLADVYLWQAAVANDPAAANTMYDNVIANCESVINSGHYFLLPGAQFTSIFNTGNTSESIFEQFANSTLNNQSSSMNQWFQSNQLWIVTLSTDALFQNIPVADYRSYSTTTNVGYNTTTRLVQKYQNNNARWIFYRLAEVYLMEAEAIAHRYPDDLTKLQQACDLVNNVRERAYYPIPAPWPIATASSTADMDKILLDERAKEFIGEGKRWFELMRFASRDNFAHKEYLTDRILNSIGGTDQLKISPRISNPDSWYLPLNTDEISNNRALVQNPYYK
jgi:hypothetical protein